MFSDPRTEGSHAAGGADELIDDRYLLDALLEHTPDHIYFKDADSRFIRVSTALARWLGLGDPTEAIGRTDFDFFAQEHARQAFADEQRLMRTGVPLVGIEELETWVDGRTTWVSTTKAPLRGRDGTVVGLFGISRDVTARKEDEQRLAVQAEQLADQTQVLERLASLDELTGLYNRRGLTTVGEQALYEARTRGNTAAVVFVDIDGLKAINDRFGHAAGDQALRAVACSLRETARESDIAARVGGDEFCLVLAAPRDANLAALPGRLERSVTEVAEREGLPFELSVSLGSIVVDPREPGSLEEMVAEADAAMYGHKRRHA